MIWEPVTATLLQTSCKRYQISRGPLEAGKFTYRAWLRAENKILASVQCYNEAGDRAAAVAECKEACVSHGLVAAWDKIDDLQNPSISK